MSAPARRQRWRLLRQIDDYAELPLIILSVVWLGLLILDLTRGLDRPLQLLSDIIWITFIADFVLRLFIAPNKKVFFKHNWITAIALVLPAARVLRFARIVRAVRSIRLVRVLTSINRGMRALGASMQRRGFGYVLALTLIVLFAGAAGMYAFENRMDGHGLQTYGESLWWTAMLMTTIGSEYWPASTEGRALTLVLSLYGLAMLGYIAGVLATFFIGRDAQSPNAEIAGETTLREMKRELTQIRERLDDIARS